MDSSTVLDELYLVMEIDAVLLQLEAAILRRRVTFGWEKSTFELLKIPEEMVQYRLDEMLCERLNDFPSEEEETTQRVAI